MCTSPDTRSYQRHFRRIRGWFSLALLQACAIVPAASAEDAPPLHDFIDQHIAAGWTARQVVPAEMSTDAEFLRRVSLDLTGVIPTAAAARAFLDDPVADKRVRLVDSLLASPGYARHMSRILDVQLIERQYGNNVTEDEWREYLRLSCEQNKPWDQLVRELLSADGTDEKTKAATRFYMVRTIDSYRVLNPTHLTRDIGRLFLGVNLQCAQCHDHPTIGDYKQADYHGIKAFVERLHMFAGKLADKPAMFIAEKPEGEISFHSVFDSERKSHQAIPHVPGGPDLLDPVLEKGKEYSVAPADGVMPIPAYSRRAALAAAVTSPDNAPFRRNIVNRLWDHMFGRGIVHPVDMAHGGNPPSHPELLELLGQRFAAQKFDIKWLLREIALSKTYQLSSVPHDSAAPPPAAAFAVAALKPLRALPLFMSMARASGKWEFDTASSTGTPEQQQLHSVFSSYGKSFDDQFGRPMGQPETGFTASPFQVLFLSNGELTGSTFSRPLPGGLIERLQKIGQPAALAEELYLSIYTRRPDAEESAAIQAILPSPADREAILADLVWAMLVSTEFRFNN